MQINKTLNKLMLGLSIITVSACSSHKNANDDQSEIKTNNSIEDNNSNLSYAGQDHIHIEELQKNNIVYFDLDKYNVSAEYAELLDTNSAILRKNPSYKVTIEGHTDERGTPEYNISLGERRANAVKIYLQSKGVEANQISIISYGKEKPAVLGHDETAYTKNRRAVLEIKQVTGELLNDQ
ncbi:peptidoglycan-associated lipoprotein Pal [Candidatus Profftia sp. (ex Adelges kitamiensis)]|uniref:peptidoglycan-associated lipoprotein Pal n=1 Tax=Candidatus Profftia sp. (ex Adelges kitamiensis) TaxID=2864218 RepID=UPI001CE2BA06|nr:peptidoglycan-associated lipoprotein Pal [Candidatus Profftia sp. (ex Adelges kitamiensis)]